MTDYPKRPILSFVIRKGRSSTAQKLAMENHWQQYGLECPDHIEPVDFFKHFDAAQPIVLEIGFGMGHSLLEQAIQSPHQQFVGIEVHPPGIGKLLNGIAEHNLKNIHIFKSNAIEVLQRAIPESSLSCVQLFFPDPWHKTRHHKRRLVQTDFINLIAQKLKSNGVFHLATDWAEYAEHMRSVFEHNPYFKASSQSELAELIKNRPTTKFEKRGIRLGHVISDLAYSRL